MSSDMVSGNGSVARDIFVEGSSGASLDPGGSLDREYLTKLWRSPVHLFRLARHLRCITSGDSVSYVINRNINFTNKCVGCCSFCAFRRSEGYVLSGEEILERLAAAEELGATEVCLQGGLAPDMVLVDYCEMLELIRSHYPKLHLHAFSPMEVFHMSRNSGLTVGESLSELKAAGLGSMPGTAAEILVDDVRRSICPEKLTTDEWVFVIKTAHGMGIPTTSTMLYGHIESFEDRLSHMELLRSIQQETGGITEFVLLPFIPGNNPLGPRAKRPGLLEHLKMHALARVALHPHITNIQTSWVKLGRAGAGATLEWGVNDFGGTLMEENISRSAGSGEGQYLSVEEICGIIEDHGYRPVQRNTLYGRV